MWFDGPNQSEPQQLKKPHVVWWTQWGWKYGSIKSHEFFVHSCALMDPKTSCGLMDPANHQGSIKPHEVLGPPKHMRFSCVVGPSNHMRFWEGKTLKILIRVHQTTWGFGSIKTHEVLKGGKLDLGPSNHMRFLGPSNHMRWWKIGKIWLGPSNHMSAKVRVQFLSATKFSCDRGN